LIGFHFDGKQTAGQTPPHFRWDYTILDVAAVFKKHQA
jgi:hypothetical protein